MGAIYPVFQPLHFCFGCQGFAWLVLVILGTYQSHNCWYKPPGITAIFPASDSPCIPIMAASKDSPVRMSNTSKL
jgi:hypothetical protein